MKERTGMNDGVGRVDRRPGRHRGALRSTGRAGGILSLLPALLLAACHGQNGATHQEIRIGDRTFRLELALTEPQRRAGLMHREELDEDGGMLFVFPEEEVQSFWMKNCLIPLDAIFLDTEGRIVAIRTMQVPDPQTPPDELPRYSSRWPARFVIELNAGTAGELGLARGDRIELPRQRLLQRVR